MNLLKKVAAALVRGVPLRFRLDVAYRLLDQAISEADLSTAESLLQHLDPRHVRLEDRIRQLKTSNGMVGHYNSAPGGPALQRCIMQMHRPWKGNETPSFDIPGMITKEEIEYYHWLSPYFSGENELVELGPWLGHSTMHLASAFGNTLRQHAKRIHVYDDFVWRPGWMNRHLRPQDPKPPAEHASFEHLFHDYTAEVADLLNVHRGKITDYDGNENLPVVSWNGGLIELIVVDCGRTIKANQAWLDCFSPAFIPNRTLVVMQDWRLHRERPRKAFNQTLLFTELNPRLELVHEVVDGGIGTFLFR